MDSSVPSSTLKSWQPKKSIIWMITLVVFFAVLTTWIWIELTNPDTLPVRSIKIQGEFSYINKRALQNAILPFMDKGLVGVDVTALKAQLQQLPWVYSATVWRIWPDTIAIRIVEQQPVARWGQRDLLNIQSEVFTPAEIMPSNLPQLEGPLGEQRVVWQTYQQMNAMLAPLGLKISEMSLEARHAWILKLNNNITLILGRDEPIKRLGRFIIVYQRIVPPAGKEINYVDLRYGHGMAIHWRLKSN